MEPEIRSVNVILRLELSHAIPEVIGDEVQLQQVLLNLSWATPNGARGACFRFSLPPRRRAYR
jgi:nitrogen-specific signal transduction histidine kinase